MADLGEWLNAALAGGTEAPLSRLELVQRYGGGEKGRAGLARRMAGISTRGKLPAKGTAERRGYDNAMRALQRGTPGINPRTGRMKQTRSGAQGAAAKIADIGRREREKSAGRKLARLAKTGGRVRLQALVSVRNGPRGDPNYTKPRDFDVDLSAEDWAAYAEIAAEGDAAGAAEFIEEVLIDARGLAGIEGRIEDVIGGTIQ